MPRFIFRSAISALALAFYAQTAFGVALGQIDDFEDGTTMNWAAAGAGAAHPFPPKNEMDGGPGGIGDNYLQLESDGIITGPPDPGSRMTTFNYLGQWSGDYIGAGVTRITMDANNFGPDALELRLLFVDFVDPLVPMPVVANIAASTVGLALASGSGWTSLVFDIGLSHLTALFGTSKEDALMNTDVLRIYHHSAPAFPAVPGGGSRIDPVDAILGLDNITAVPVPPAMVLFISGIAGLLARRRLR